MINKDDSSTVFCDCCSGEFEIEILSQNMKYGKKSINVNYFVCPYCSALYVVSIMDDVLRYKMSRMNVVKKKIQRAHKKRVSEHELTKLVDKYDLIHKDVKEYEEVLRNKYERFLTVVKTEGKPQPDKAEIGEKR